MLRNLALVTGIVLLALTAQPLAADLAPAQATSSSSMTTVGTPALLDSPSGLDNAVGSQVTGTPDGTGGGAQLGTFATVSHALGQTKSISMSWRTRTLNESFPWEPNAAPTQPPLNISAGVFGLASDVVDLTGFAPGDVYVLQMSYNDSLFNEASQAAVGCVHIDWLNPQTGMWEDATLGNSLNASSRLINYQGSWADAGKPMTLGSWGVDTGNNVAWVVVDHNSSFAVAPEPSSIALLLSGAVGCVFSVIRRRKARS